MSASHSHSIPIISYDEVEHDPHVSNEKASLPILNIHPIITRNKDGTYKPKVYLANLDKTEPRIVSQALKHEGWYKSMQLEFNGLIKSQTRPT